ncbi:hypothetical protein L228DRAFT_247292 [Xylona heveae TC161]|uniref:Uncharacterized protein n=1 Tax=Xylona heveae (strain CBS 132557 / TC161) TaxID=1328760 RepID=A0A161W025_XYLHT|nr:hypothetical protein L228DRAFT_247292 [Xylona heveae TC161]KZF22883.1 hypothetical protein L228DRAFT_247292 [Xylona heveae TC161]
MDTNSYQAPDLASVLRTLAQYAPPVPNTSEAALNHNVSANTEATGDDDYEPIEDPGSFSAPQAFSASHWTPSTNLITAPTTTTDGAPQSYYQNGHGATGRTTGTSTPQHSATPIPGPTPTPSAVDPSTITDWSTALKCVMKTVARSEAIQVRVRKMIQVQHDHEKQWFEGRKALLEKQSARAEGKKKLDAVLLSVGGIVPTSSTVSTPEDDAAEIKRYDIKVHRAATEMVKAMTTELEHLGIPFFGTKSHLIVARSSADGHTPTSSGPGPGQGQGQLQLQQALTATELNKLQRRMLELLEDMCKE